MITDIIKKYLLKSEIDYKEVLEAKDEIYECEDGLINEINEAYKKYKHTPEIMIYIVLLASINSKKAYKTILKAYDLPFGKQELIFGEYIIDGLPLVLEMLFDGDYKAIMDLILKKSRKEYASILFSVLSKLCYYNNKPEIIENFIKGHLDNEIYPGYYGDIVEAFSFYKNDSLLQIVRYLNFTGKIDFFLFKSYLELMEIYFKDVPEAKADFDKIMAQTSSFVTIKNLPQKKYQRNALDDFYDKQDEIDEYFSTNPYTGEFETYLSKALADLKLNEIYDLEKSSRISDATNIDFIVYEFLLIEESITNNEYKGFDGFLQEYYSYIIKEFEDYISQSGITYEQFDGQKSIHFMINDIYSID